MDLLEPETDELDFSDIQPLLSVFRSGSLMSKSLLSLGEGLIDSAKDAEPTGRAAVVITGYEQYQDDPVRFGEEIFGHRYTDEVKEMMRSVVTYTNTSARSANAVGKTYAAAVVILWFFLVYGDAQVYMFAAPPESNLKTLLWGEISKLVYDFPHVFAEYEITSSMLIKRHGKSFVIGVTIPQAADPKQIETRFSGKHAPHMLFVGDEADGIPEAVFKGVDGCMSGGHCRLLLTFNPKAEAGTPFRMEKDGEANVVHLSALTHPNVVFGPDEKGNDIFPGAVTREKTCRRINMWTRPLRPGEKLTSECFLVPDYLVGYVAIANNGKPYPPIPAGMRMPTNTEFSYKVLGMYPAQAVNQLISRIWIENARARYDLYVARYGDVPPAGTQAIMGQDVADMGDDMNAAVLRYGGYVRLPIVWGGVDPIVTGDHAARLYKRYGARECNVDGTGVGAGVASYMRRKGCPNSHRIMFGASPDEKQIPEHFKELGHFLKVRNLGYWGLREWLRTDEGAMLPPDDLLLEELATPTYSQTTKGDIVIMDSDTLKEILGRSADRMSALVLTFCPKPKEAIGSLSVTEYA